MYIINVPFGRLDFAGKGFHNLRRIHTKYNPLHRDWLGGSCFGKDYTTVMTYRYNLEQHNYAHIYIRSFMICDY